MIPGLSTLLVASILKAEESQVVDLRPVAAQRVWWQKALDKPWMERIGSYTYSQYLADCYLLAHPQEAKRVGKLLLSTIIVNALRTVT